MTLTCVAISAPCIFLACASQTRRLDQVEVRRLYPPPPQPTYVLALGNLRSGAPPTQTETDIALFLFGEEPEPPLAFIRPLSVALDQRGLLTCDAALGLTLRWNRETHDLDAPPVSPQPGQPVAAVTAPNGDILIADARANAVLRYDAAGELVAQYHVEGRPFRPSAVLSVGEEIWVSNVIGHRIEVFDAASGSHNKSIGRRGRGPGEFAGPLGLARTPDGNICVVDSLNCRVQLLDAGGKYLATVGGPGDLVGSFGRPKGVAVGPDGTIFVTDAASQRVHAFDSHGRPLLAFGQPGDGPGALCLPGGICASPQSPLKDSELPDDFEARYYILVAEQLLRPGIRVYAWGQSTGTRSSTQPLATAPPRAGGAINPHWSPANCKACHSSTTNGVQRISHHEVDALCLSCHDGKKARAEAHPIGRLAHTRNIQPPAEWPLVEGRLGCLTCHDIVRHCRDDVRRPLHNSAMLRRYDPNEPLALCTSCHKPADSWRISPHVSVDDQGKVNEQSCRFCHTETPPVPESGVRTLEPHVYVESSQLCLTCHSRHWDVSPRGHVDRPVPEWSRRTMVANEMPDPHDANDAAPPGVIHDKNLMPQWLPLAPPPPQQSTADPIVTCYTCHNPHGRGLFPSDTPLGMISNAPGDAHAALRISGSELCFHCHPK